MPARSLAGFKVPASFVRLDVVPRTSGGKLRREAVRALVADEATGQLARPGGDAIGWRRTGAGARPLLLLHGTLSTSQQLDRLAQALAAPGDLAVHAIDRRGSGTGRLADPRPLDVATHVDDLRAYLDARGFDRVDVVGVSFGGVLAPRARRPPAGSRPRRRRVRAALRRAGRSGDASPGSTPSPATRSAPTPSGGLPAPPRRSCGRSRAMPHGTASRTAPGRSSRGRATAPSPTPASPASTPTASPGSAARSRCSPARASEPFYVPIAEALAARIPAARHRRLEGLDHPAPITRAAVVADAVRAALELPA